MTAAPAPGRSLPALLRFAAVAATALSLAYLVGRDGSPLWQGLRVLAVVLAAAGAAALVPRSDRRLRGPALLVLGVAGAAAGAGIAASWLAKTGFGITALAGAIALTAGLGSLILGFVDLFSAGRGRLRRAALVLSIPVVAILLLSLAIAVAATNVPPTALGDETPHDRGLPYDPAEFTTEDGVTLYGWYLPSQNGAAVVLAHGAGSTRSAVLDQAAVLARAGYGVLLFDARGHGESGGRAMDFGWFGDSDIGAAVTYLVGRPGVNAGRIAAIGLSMGGEQAIGAAAGDPRLQGVVAEGAPGRTAADKSWLSEEYGFRGWVQEGVDHLIYWCADLLTSARPPLSLRDAAARMAPRPLLLITAGDVPDERLAAEHVQAAAPATVQVWDVPGAGHTSGLATAPDEWANRVLAFLDGLLLKAAEG